jgi:hypothetical protein
VSTKKILKEEPGETVFKRELDEIFFRKEPDKIFFSEEPDYLTAVVGRSRAKGFAGEQSQEDGLPAGSSEQVRPLLPCGMELHSCGILYSDRSSPLQRMQIAPDERLHSSLVA